MKRAVPKELFFECDGLLQVNRIFVGGLRQEVEESDLREYFGKYGKVCKVELMVDRHTNAKRGFAFIEFDDYDPVDKAVMQGKHKIGGQDVSVRKGNSFLHCICFPKRHCVYRFQLENHYKRVETYEQ